MARLYSDDELETLLEFLDNARQETDDADEQTALNKLYAHLESLYSGGNVWNAKRVTP